MPSPLTVDKDYKQKIKNYLNELYHIEVRDSYDCKVLSDRIFAAKGLRISLSTVRRFYGLVKYTGAHSKYVLNQLAIAIGFESYEIFEKHTNKYDVNSINQKIQLYRSNYEKYRIDLVDLLRLMQFRDWENAYQIQGIISAAILKKDIDLLKEIVSFDFCSSNVNVDEFLPIVFQEFYFAGLCQNDFVISFVEQWISESYNLQRYLLQSYVDESQLNGFIGSWLNAVKNEMVPDLTLFKMLLLTQEAYNNRKRNTSIRYYNKSIKFFNNAKYYIHPILKARISAWSIILDINDKLFYNIIKELNDFNEVADFCVILSRLLWTYNKIEFLQFLDEKKLEKFPVVKTYFEKGRYNILKLSLSINYYLDDNFNKAKLLFEQVDKSTFGYDIVNLDFYSKWIDVLNENLYKEG